MPQRLFMDAGAQSTCASAINNTQTSVTLQSASGFTVPSGSQQFSVVILDSGNPAWNAASPLATPYEYQQVNSVSGNVLQFGPGGGGASRVAYAGTTPRSFFAGATIAQVALAEDFNASFPVKIDEQSPTGASVTIPASGSIPQTGRKIRINWKARDTGAGTGGDFLLMQFNGTSSPGYDWTMEEVYSSSPIFTNFASQSQARVGVVPAGGAAAGLFNSGWIEIIGYMDTIARKHYLAMSFRNDGTTLGFVLVGGQWQQNTVAITSITLSPGAGNFASGSFFTTELYP